jgi:hypothetical protein
MTENHGAIAKAIHHVLQRIFLVVRSFLHIIFLGHTRKEEETRD